MSEETEAVTELEVEPKTEVVYDWFSIRNIKVTEMQLWMGDKKIANIQGGKYFQDIEEFVRMANLGIVVHREEIKRRVEALLEPQVQDTWASIEPRDPEPMDEDSKIVGRVDLLDT